MTQPAASRTAREEFRADWPLLLAAMMGVGLTSVLPYASGVFIGPIRQEFGWSTEAVLLGHSFIGILGSIVSPFFGSFIRWFGARRIVLAGALIMSAGTTGLGLIPNSFPAYLACHFIIAIGHTMEAAVIWQKVVVERFVTARGLAVSIALCGSNIAGLISPMLATYVIERANWHVAYQVLAAYLFLSAFPLAWFFFRETPGTQPRLSRKAAAAPPAPPPPGMEPRGAFRTREFWLMLVSFACAGLGITGYMIYFVPMLESQGHSPLLAASVVSSLSVAALAGRLLAGFGMDRMFAPWLAALALALPVLGSLLLLYAPPSYGTALLAAILTGLSAGAEFNMIAYLATRYFGLRSYGTVAGIFYGAFMFGGLGGQQIPARLLHGGGYDRVIVFFGSAFFIATVMMLFCRAYPKTQLRELVHGA